MRRGEGLVQVQVHHVRAKVARPHLAHQRVHVRAVHVQQRALRMQDVRNLVNLALEYADGRRVGQHQRGRIFIHHALQLGDIHHALRIRLQVRHLVPRRRRRRGIRPMRRVRESAPSCARCPSTRGTRATSRIPVNSPCAPAAGCSVIASMPVISIRHSLSSFMICRHPCASDSGRYGCASAMPSMPRDHLIHPRVVLHGAASQRIHPQVDRVVPRREPREVADDLNLAQLRHHARDHLCARSHPAGKRHPPPAHPAPPADTPSSPATTSQRSTPRSG